MNSRYRGGNKRASAGGARRSNQRKGGNDAIHGHIHRIPERVPDPVRLRKPEVESEEGWLQGVIHKLPELDLGKTLVYNHMIPEDEAFVEPDTTFANLDRIAVMLGCRPREMAKVLAFLLGTEPVLKHTRRTKLSTVYALSDCFLWVTCEWAFQEFLKIYSTCGVCGKQRLIKDRMRWSKKNWFWWNSCRECEGKKPDMPVERLAVRPARKPKGEPQLFLPGGKLH